MSSLLAQRGLYEHAAAVAAGLREGLAQGRAAVARIVGRDPEQLDGPAVARAAIESTAENFADGVAAPVFWGAVLGLPGMLAYKAVNTADSMIGHRSSRYMDFGRFAARLDDVASWLPARLAALLILAAASFSPGTTPAAGWRAMGRDAALHRSVNAGWPEAAMAGSLGLRLAGPRRYGGQPVEDAWMGDGTPLATPADIRRALKILVRACVLTAGLLALGLCRQAHSCSGAGSANHLRSDDVAPAARRRAAGPACADRPRRPCRSRCRRNRPRSSAGTSGRTPPAGRSRREQSSRPFSPPPWKQGASSCMLCRGLPTGNGMIAFWLRACTPDLYPVGAIMPAYILCLG